MKLGDWMQARNLRDEEVAELVESDRSTISRVRRGVSRPSWDLAEKLAAVTDGAVMPNDYLDAPSPEAA